MQIGEEKEVEIQDLFVFAQDDGIYEIETPQGWVEIGDLIMKRDKDCYLIRTNSGKELGGSSDHYVETTNGWEKLEDINVQNTTVYTSSGEDDIVSKEYIGKDDTYDLEVKNNDHKYYANGIVSHNTGKTMLCKILAKEVDATVIYVLPSHVKQLFDISRICDMARELAPSLIIIEDIDFLTKDRTGGNNWSVVELMNQMDGIEDFKDIITLATTNMVDDIEKAIKNRPGRFDRVIDIPSPDLKTRIRMFNRFCVNFNIGKDVDFSKIAKETNNATGAYIKDVCITAAFIAIQDGSVNKNGKVIIFNKHFNESLREIKDKDFSRFSEVTNSKRSIGFGDSPKSD